MRAKAQAAMEYLMTYGWAILVIIAVVAALYAMGVFRIAAPPVPCSPCFAYFAFVDYSAGTLVITNGAREIDTLTVYEPAGATISPTSADPGEQINIIGIPTTGSPTVLIGYRDVRSGLYHNDTAVIHNP
jgi:hypothetical protein